MGNVQKDGWISVFIGVFLSAGVVTTFRTTPTPNKTKRRHTNNRYHNIGDDWLKSTNHYHYISSNVSRHLSTPPQCCSLSRRQTVRLALPCPPLRLDYILYWFPWNYVAFSIHNSIACSCHHISGYWSRWCIECLFAVWVRWALHIAARILAPLNTLAVNIRAMGSNVSNRIDAVLLEDGIEISYF